MSGVSADERVVPESAMKQLRIRPNGAKEPNCSGF